jgi:hypothetical protein
MSWGRIPILPAAHAAIAALSLLSLRSSCSTADGPHPAVPRLTLSSRANIAAAGASHDANARCGEIDAAPGPAFASIERLANTRDEVRILVFGQSISEQAWWWQTRDWLREIYPDGNLVMEEHASGGCAAQCLIGREAWSLDGSRYNRLPEAVFSWRPQLVIFHAYGDDVDYSYIAKGLKHGCSAFDDYEAAQGRDAPSVRCTPEQRAISQGYVAPEVLVQNDFMASDIAYECPLARTKSNWHCFMNEHVIPREVAKYGYRLQDNFHRWPAYIAQRGIDPKTLLQPDNTHLAEPEGTDLMFLMTAPHLCYARF